MKWHKRKFVLKILLRSFIVLICVAVGLICLLLFCIMVEQKESRNHLNVFSEQLVSYPLPTHTVVLDTFNAAGSTAGMGDNQFYYTVLLVESALNQETIEHHYAATPFVSAQKKGSFDNKMSTMKTRVFPIADWQILRNELCNIEDDNAFLPWVSQEGNTNCYLVVLSDGTYFSWFGQEPYFY